MELLNIAVNDSGIPILPKENPESRKAFFKLFFETETGKKLAPYLTKDGEERIGEILDKWFPNDSEITINKLERVVENLLAIRDPALIPAEPEPAAINKDTRPRRADGTFISEFEVWASEPSRSMKEIRARADREPEFREWFHRVSVGQTLQDGGLRIAGTATRTPTPTDHQLLGEFVRLFRTTPSSRMKPLAGIITLGDTRYTVQEFNGLIDRASAAGLL